MLTFALEKQMHLERKQTHFILTLPVAGAVCTLHVCTGTIILSNSLIDVKINVYIYGYL